MTLRLIPALLFALFLVPAAIAQDAQELQPRFTDAELDAFATAYMEVEDIRATQAEELAMIDDPVEAQNIQERNNARIDEVLSANSLSAERYNEILAAVEADAELSSDVRTRIQRHDP